MVRRWRFTLVATWVAMLVMLAAVAIAVVGSGSSSGPRPVVVQPAPAAAASSRPVDAFVPPATDAPTTSTTTRATTVAPTTVAPTTVAPKRAPTTTAPPRTAPPAVVRPPVTVPVTTAPATTGGSARDFSLLGYRWNPCRLITVASSGPDIAGMVSELASITGLHLQLVTGAAQITVQWGAVPPGGEIGQTAWRAVGGWLNLVTVIISPQAQPYLATVLRHELGHSLGLGHASHPDEVMYPTAGHSSPTDYQPGDLAGLQAIGASAGGC